jgi:hypothetical protein
LFYGGLALTAGQLLLGFGGGGSSPKDWTALLLSQPFGWVLVMGIGIAVIGYGLHQLYQAYQAKFREYLKLNEISDREGTWITRAGRFGLAARGVVFGIVGVLVILAALRFEPSEAGSLGDALQALLRQPFGPWMWVPWHSGSSPTGYSCPRWRATAGSPQVEPSRTSIIDTISERGAANGCGISA